jgi:cytoskeleton protein RodZ
MLAHESTYCVAVPGGNAEVSLNGLRAILGQVEAELYQSEIYGQMLSSLKALPDDLHKQVQCMVKAVGREAIRLALRKMVRKKPLVPGQPNNQVFTNQAVPAPAPKTLQLATQPSADATEQAAIAGDRDHPTNITVLPVERQVTPPSGARRTLYPPTPLHLAKRLANPHKKLSKRELARQAALEARESCLQALGQTIRQARHERSWSPYHLHIKTQIPMHQLEALESGCIERLPEDIYLRGFIRQAGNALGLDGNQLAASLPAIDAATAVLPSWQQPKAHSGLRLNSMHIYLGYAALMAGGIAWVSHQSMPHQEGAAPTPTATVAPLPKTSPAQPTNYKANPKNTAALNAKQSTATPSAISPPENNPL